jgi:hypothetical protein
LRGRSGVGVQTSREGRWEGRRGGGRKGRREGGRDGGTGGAMHGEGGGGEREKRKVGRRQTASESVRSVHGHGARGIAHWHVLSPRPWSRSGHGPHHPATSPHGTPRHAMAWQCCHYLSRPASGTAWRSFVTACQSRWHGLTLFVTACHGLAGNLQVGQQLLGRPVPRTGLPGMVPVGDGGEGGERDGRGRERVRRGKVGKGARERERESGSEGGREGGREGGTRSEPVSQAVSQPACQPACKPARAAAREAARRAREAGVGTADALHASAPHQCAGGRPQRRARALSGSLSVSVLCRAASLRLRPSSLRRRRRAGLVAVGRRGLREDIR